MREIKFRALAVVNDKHAEIKVGDFVYGHYIESGCDAPCIIFGDGEQIEVDKKTLGQLTGLQDKKGVDIYEGDLIQNKSGRVCVVAWMDLIASFDCVVVSTVKNDNSHWFTPAYWVSHVEVIGNIHQTPELLEASK